MFRVATRWYPLCPSARQTEARALTASPGDARAADHQFPGGRLRVLLAAPDTPAPERARWRTLLDGLAEVEVVAEATDGDEALRLIAERPPDVTLVHHALRGPQGLSTMARVAQEHPGLRLVLLSASTDPEDVHRALRAGARGYLLSDADRLELQLALRAVARGDHYLSPAALTPILARFARSRRTSTPTEGAAGLTPRQREVLRLIAEGYPTRTIAQRLGLSVKTVETHRMHVMKRLGTRSVAALVRYAVRIGLVKQEP